MNQISVDQGGKISQRTNELGSKVSEKLENIDTHSDSVALRLRNTRPFRLGVLLSF